MIGTFGIKWAIIAKQKSMLIDCSTYNNYVWINNVEWIRQGIYDDPSCSSNVVNHAMLIVGYTPDYWIVKNWWGRSWGLDGYMHLRKGINRCGIANYAAYAKIWFCISYAQCIYTVCYIFVILYELRNVVNKFFALCVNSIFYSSMNKISTKWRTR